MQFVDSGDPGFHPDVERRRALAGRSRSSPAGTRSRSSSAKPDPPASPLEGHGRARRRPAPVGRPRSPRREAAAGRGRGRAPGRVRGRGNGRRRDGRQRKKEPQPEPAAGPDQSAPSCCRARAAAMGRRCRGSSSGRGQDGHEDRYHAARRPARRGRPARSAMAPPARFAIGMRPIEVRTYRLRIRPRGDAGDRTWMSVFVVE